MNIKEFIKAVDTELFLAVRSGILPEPDREKAALERLGRKYPDMEVNPEEEFMILKHARFALNAHRN